MFRRLHAEEPASEPSSNAPFEALPVIVGREGHLQALQEAFAALRERCSVMVFVHGNSGMGKTTIVQSFLTEVSRSGVRRLYFF